MEQQALFKSQFKDEYLLRSLAPLALVNQSKLDSAFVDWIAPMQAKPAEWAQYQQQHAIPALASYGLDQFEEFFKQRRLLLMSRLKQVLG